VLSGNNNFFLVISFFLFSNFSRLFELFPVVFSKQLDKACETNLFVRKTRQPCFLVVDLNKKEIFFAF
jgi:hypothetical protein